MLNGIGRFYWILLSRKKLFKGHNDNTYKEFILTDFNNKWLFLAESMKSVYVMLSLLMSKVMLPIWSIICIVILSKVIIKNVIVTLSPFQKDSFQLKQMGNLSNWDAEFFMFHLCSCEFWLMNECLTVLIYYIEFFCLERKYSKGTMTILIKTLFITDFNNKWLYL
jgi:hypothetical protein